MTGCVFPDGSADSIVNLLEGNSTLLTLRLVENIFDEDEGLCHAVTASLRVNTTLTDLTLHMLPSAHFSSSLPIFFKALKTHTSLKKLDLNYVSLSDPSLCAALCEFFAENVVLQELTMHCSNSLLRDTDMASWRTVLPFLRDNKTLKSFTFHADKRIRDPRAVATLCCGTVAVLEAIALWSVNMHSSGISTDAYLSAFESLQMNTTLKRLRLYHDFVDATSENDMTKRMIRLVKKNYALEDLNKAWFSYDETGELRTILRLNRAGRHYLIQDMGSIAKGVEVLIAVRDHLDSVFYYLRENPLLCDIERCHLVTGKVVSK